MANLLTFKPVDKDRYFYDKYRYCVSFALDEVSAMKTLDHNYIDAIIDRRKLWREVAQQRWTLVRPGGQPQLAQTILTRRWKDITDKTSEDLHDLAELLLTTTADFKLVTSVNLGWIYTNNMSLIKRLNTMGFLDNKEYTEAILSRPKNTIKLKVPKFTHRSYFKSVKLTQTSKDTLINFFNNQQDTIRVAPAFTKWLTSSPYLRTQDYFFIDHDGEGWLVMLELISPGIIRKTLEIIPA